MPITNKTPLDQIIHDFVHSKDKRFDGKSTKERIKMAQGAYYSMHEKNSLDESLKSSLKTVRNLAKKSIKAVVKTVVDPIGQANDELSGDKNKKFWFKELTKNESIVPFSKFITENIENENIARHMADKDYNVVSFKKIGDMTHVRVNNLPEDKHGLVPAEEHDKAQKHLDELGLKNHVVHTYQTIRTTTGGRFNDRGKED